MRSKEEAADYRYFPDPDLALIVISKEMLDEQKESLPELPEQKFKRYTTQHGLTAYEAEILVFDVPLAKFYDAAYTYTKSKLLINWILRDLMSLLKDQQTTLSEIKLTPENLAQLIELIERGVINNRTAQNIFVETAATGKEPKIIVREQGLEQIGDTAALEKIIKEIIDSNPGQVAAYKSGKQQLFGFFVGQAMQKTQGKANPQVINELLKKHLA
jgi:aspartyl-tRNA(Asn)/glutamyl-tRNA(Gln) amidotransferase subunit B